MRHLELARCATMALHLAVASGVLAASPAIEPDIVLQPAAGASPKGLSVALFAADSTLKSPVEALQPTQSWPVAALKVSLNANTGLCGEHTIAGILVLPNQDKDQSNPDGPDCIFGMQLSIEGGPRKVEIATECGDWVDNAALCWGYGQTGEFRLVRESAAATAKLKLVFPGPVAPAPKPASGEDPAAQKQGLFLDTIVDDKKVNQGDLWLVWTTATVEIAYTR